MQTSIRLSLFSKVVEVEQSFNYLGSLFRKSSHTYGEITALLLILHNHMVLLSIVLFNHLIHLVMINC